MSETDSSDPEKVNTLHDGDFIDLTDDLEPPRVEDRVAADENVISEVILPAKPVNKVVPLNKNLHNAPVVDLTREQIPPLAKIRVKQLSRPSGATLTPLQASKRIVSKSPNNKPGQSAPPLVHDVSRPGQSKQKAPMKPPFEPNRVRKASEVGNKVVILPNGAVLKPIKAKHAVIKPNIGALEKNAPKVTQRVYNVFNKNASKTNASNAIIPPKDRKVTVLNNKLMTVKKLTDLKDRMRILMVSDQQREPVSKQPEESQTIEKEQELKKAMTLQEIVDSQPVIQSDILVQDINGQPILQKGLVHGQTIILQGMKDGQPVFLNGIFQSVHNQPMLLTEIIQKKSVVFNEKSEPVVINEMFQKQPVVIRELNPQQEQSVLENVVANETLQKQLPKIVEEEQSVIYNMVANETVPNQQTMFREIAPQKTPEHHVLYNIVANETLPKQPGVFTKVVPPKPDTPKDSLNNIVIENVMSLNDSSNIVQVKKPPPEEEDIICLDPIMDPLSDRPVPPLVRTKKTPLHRIVGEPATSEPHFKVPEPPVFRTVDIAQILGRGSRPVPQVINPRLLRGRCIINEKVLGGEFFYGFSDKTRRSSCIKQLATIINDDERTLARLRAEAKLKYLRMPRRVKEVDVANTLAKVNEEVLQVNITASDPKTAQALMLIKKGLEMIQNATKEKIEVIGDILEKGSPSPVRRIITKGVKKASPTAGSSTFLQQSPPAVKRSREPEEIEEKPFVPVKRRRAGRGRPRRVPKSAKEDVDDLLVVKKVDIIYGDGRKKLGRQRKKVVKNIADLV